MPCTNRFKGCTAALFSCAAVVSLHRVRNKSLATVRLGRNALGDTKRKRLGAAPYFFREKKRGERNEESTNLQINKSTN